MTERNDGGPAFPNIDFVEDAGGFYRTGGRLGMTLRDYFAAKAMQALLTTPTAGLVGGRLIDTVQELSAAAYRTADAMLEARR